MQGINRTAVIIKPKQPFVDWINNIPDEGTKITLEDIDENSTFLIPEFVNNDEALKYIKKVYAEIFDEELFAWYQEESLFPKNRTWKMFQEWFYIEINSIVLDIVDEEIEKEE